MSAKLLLLFAEILANAPPVGSETRITEDNDIRVTENGDIRVTEGNN
jgi:hypothetical protein